MQFTGSGPSPGAAALGSAAGPAPGMPADGAQAATQRMLMLGEATWLLMQSPLHRHCRLDELAAHLLPAMRHDQLRIYRNARGPVGLVAWAWLGDAAAARYAAGTHWLGPDDWRSGPALWFIEFVAPFGHGRRIVDDLRGGLFRGHTARARRVRGPGLPPRQMHWHGIDVPPAG